MRRELTERHQAKGASARQHDDASAVGCRACRFLSCRRGHKSTVCSKNETRQDDRCVHGTNDGIAAESPAEPGGKRAANRKDDR